MKRFLFVLAALLPSAAFAQILTGVPDAIDGDTMSMDGFRIRLRGIDAPELAQTCMRQGEAWLCGQEAKVALATLIAGNQVVCEQKDLDQYGRIVAICRVGRMDLSDELARTGMAVALPEFTADYVASEAIAQRYRIGIWDSEFQLPWEFRAANPHASRENARPSEAGQTEPVMRRPSVYFRNCSDARAAGAAPLYRGQPGYRQEMDGDHDGIACEPYRGRR